MHSSGLLALSNAALPSGEVVVWHSYALAGNRARLLQTASLFRDSRSSAERNAIGRANRALHYEDMIAFRSAVLNRLPGLRRFFGSASKGSLGLAAMTYLPNGAPVNPQ